VLKVMTSLEEHPTRQATIIILGSYISYATAEICSAPGVLSVFFCGRWDAPLLYAAPSHFSGRAKETAYMFGTKTLAATDSGDMWLGWHRPEPNWCSSCIVIRPMETLVPWGTQ
jgi:hypothetical protein